MAAVKPIHKRSEVIMGTMAAILGALVQQSILPREALEYFAVLSWPLGRLLQRATDPKV